MKAIPAIFILFALHLFSCTPESKKNPSGLINPPDHITNGLPTTAPSVETLIQNLNTGTRLEAEHIGFTGAPSTSYIFYKQLVKIADDSTLFKLTYHQNPKMRVYGMWGLSLKNDKLAEEQLDRFYLDSSMITETSGCITFTLPIYDIATREIDSAVIAKHRSKMFKPIVISY